MTAQEIGGLVMGICLIGILIYIYFKAKEFDNKYYSSKEEKE